MKERINDLINDRIYRNGEVIKFDNSTSMLRHFMIMGVFVKGEVNVMVDEVETSETSYYSAKKEFLECCEMLEAAINRTYYSNHLNLAGSSDSKKVADELIEFLEDKKVRV